MKFHSTKILILVILANFAALGGYYLLFQHIKKQTKLTSSLTETIDEGEKKNGQLSSLRAVVKDTDGKRQELKKLLLRGEDEIVFIEHIETLGKKNGLEVTTNSVSSVQTDIDAIKVFKLQIQTLGSWSNTLNFLNQLENQPYNIRVLQSAIAKQGATQKGGSAWTASFDITVTETTL